MDTGEDTLAPWFPLHPNLTFSAEEWEALWTPRPRQPSAHDDNEESNDSGGDDEEVIDPERDN